MTMDNTMTTRTLSNDVVALRVSIQDQHVHLRLIDQATGFVFSDGPYFYQATYHPTPARLMQDISLEDASLEMAERAIVIQGAIAGLRLTQRLTLPPGAGALSEQINLKNQTAELVRLKDFHCGMARRLTNRVGRPLPDLSGDRFQAVPFLHRPTDPTGLDNDFSVSELLEKTGNDIRLGEIPVFVEHQGGLPSLIRHSEGWAWQHGDITLGIFKFNQQAIEFSLLAVETDDKDGTDGAWLRFGGCGILNGEPSKLLGLQPEEYFDCGETRYQVIPGSYTQTAYAFREFLDERGCRFPEDYNPPIHWNELYDNPEWNLATPGRPADRSQHHNPTKSRQYTYTRALIIQEAEKARLYGCQSLYLDPGWDTTFGSFLWGEGWLGERKDFIEQVDRDYGLKVSLHCPLATWMSFDRRSVESWSPEALRMDSEGKIIPGSFCLGSKQYLAEAEERLLAHCQDGVAFLMFDGNWYNDGCWNPDHGHPVPYTYEDHCRANLDLAQRIHARYPQVLIEMHDMISGGSILRYTPVYYKYGLPGSYDENWGFELMWQPMEDILSGRARSLYYYNLACNVPVYLHVDLRDDNLHCLVLWWYASTCRHLGIGGTHEDPLIARAQQLAMQRYRRLERFYKQGVFYGFGEETHVHVLPEENAFVANLFNLSAEERVISASLPVADLGLHPDQWFVCPKSAWFNPNQGTFHIQRRMPAWSAQVAEVRAL
jgi:hypothetical protein